MKVFISWSKESSKAIALELKRFVEEFFQSKTLEFYISATNILPGESWLDSIRSSIKDSEMCLLVLTDENEFSRWTHFEAGAVAFNTKSSNIVPLLFTSRDMDSHSPLRQFQFLKNNDEDILKILHLIKSNGRLRAVKLDEMHERFAALIPRFRENISKILDQSVTEAIEKVPYGEIFPAATLQVEKGKLFVGAAMAALPDQSAYEKHRLDIAHIADAAEICCPSIRRTYWAGKDVETCNDFDGEQVALQRDLSQLKSSEACVFILLENLPSSVLVEIGYAIALNKPMVIFCHTRKNLPFLLRRADHQIHKLSVYEVNDTKQIEETFDKEGDALFTINHL